VAGDLLSSAFFLSKASLHKFLFLLHQDFCALITLTDEELAYIATRGPVPNTKIDPKELESKLFAATYFPPSLKEYQRTKPSATIRGRMLSRQSMQGKRTSDMATPLLYRILYVATWV